MNSYRRCSAPPFQDRHLEDAGAAAGTQQQHAYSRHPTAAAPTLQQQAPVDLYYYSRQSHRNNTALLSQLLLAQANVDFKLPIHNFAAGDPALEYI